MISVTIGVSLKSYFDRSGAIAWCSEVAGGLRSRPAVENGAIRVFVLPSYVQISDATRIFAGTPVRVGAQNVSRFPLGAYTGEVPAGQLADFGVTYAEIGHAERRRLLGETDADAAAKAAAAIRSGLTPVLCLGEAEHTDARTAASAAVAQLAANLAGVPAGPVVVAYEPVWAIGAPQPAPRTHITAVIRALRQTLQAAPERAGSAVIYGGSAGPGLLTELDGEVDGLFLGRFAHDPEAFLAVLDEAAALTKRRAA